MCLPCFVYRPTYVYLVESLPRRGRECLGSYPFLEARSSQAEDCMRELKRHSGDLTLDP